MGIAPPAKGLRKEVNYVEGIMVNPEGGLEIGEQVAEWNKQPYHTEVMTKTNWEDYERKSGKVVDENVIEAR